MPEMELTLKMRWHFEPGDDIYTFEVNEAECLATERSLLGGEAPSVGIVEYVGIVSSMAEVAWDLQVVPEGEAISFQTQRGH